MESSYTYCLVYVEEPILKMSRRRRTPGRLVGSTAPLIGQNPGVTETSRARPEWPPGQQAELFYDSKFDFVPNDPSVA